MNVTSQPTPLTTTDPKAHCPILPNKKNPEAAKKYFSRLVLTNRGLLTLGTQHYIIINTDMSIKATLRILHTKLSFLLSHAVKVAQLVNITGDLIHIFSLVLAFSMSFG